MCKHLRLAAPRDREGVMVDRLFVATKAFIEDGGEVLVLRESAAYADGANTGRFDVAGGRVRPGEHYEACLEREVGEETGLAVDVGEPFFVDEWRPVVDGEQWQVVGIYFACTADSRGVVLSKDHDMYTWIDPDAHGEYAFVPGLHDAFNQFRNRSPV